MQKGFVILAVVAAMSVFLSAQASAECDGTAGLRAQLVAQNTANIERVVSTKNCALIPGVISWLNRANANLNRAMIQADCTPIGSQTSAAGVVAILRKACGADQKEAAAKEAKVAQAKVAQTKVAQTKVAQTKVAEAKERAAVASASDESSPGPCGSTVTGPGMAPSSGPCKEAGGTVGRPPGRVATATQEPVKKAPEKPPAPFANDSGATIESLRELMPQIGKVIDDVDNDVNSKALAPGEQWRKPNEQMPSSPTVPASAPKSLPLAGPDQAAAPDEKEDHVAALDPAVGGKAKEAPAADDEDKDYAAICKSDSVKDGLKSLKQDYLNALKPEAGRFGLKFFREKLKLQWATLKKCAQDPMQKAVIDKLENDPIILQPE